MHWAGVLGAFLLALALLSGSIIDTTVSWMDVKVHDAIDQQIVWREDSPPPVQGVFWGGGERRSAVEKVVACIVQVAGAYRNQDKC